MKFSYISKSAHGTKSAFTLIEVTLAMGIATFCLLTVFSLLPIGITTNQNASEQTTASGIATAISADLHGNLVVGGTTSRFALQIPNAGASPSTSTSPSASVSAQTLFFSQDGNVSENGTPASRDNGRCRRVQFLAVPGHGHNVRGRPVKNSACQGL